MSNGRGTRKKASVSVRGPWLAMPLDFLQSRACAELSPAGLKMFVDLCAQLGPNARGNGDLSASPATLAPRGWGRSNATRIAALRELVDAKLVAITRQGDRRRCALYAVTLWPIQCDPGKLEYGPGSYSTADWEADGRAAKPTVEQPAKPRSVRSGEPKNAKSSSAAGQGRRVIGPQRDNQKGRKASYVPAAGKQLPESTPEVVPPGDTFSRLPSVGAASTSLPAVGIEAVSAGGSTSRLVADLVKKVSHAA